MSHPARTAVAAVIAAAVVVSAPGVWASPDTSSSARKLPRICAEEVSWAKVAGVDLSRLSSEGTVAIDGRQVAPLVEPGSWRVWDPEDPSFGTRFHGMAWLVPGVRSGLPVVDLLLAREAALPDPGSAVGNAELRVTGWTAGALRLRMGTVSCLYAAKRDERLIPIMEALVAANLDAVRYRGAPLNPVHNQGTLANVALLEAARVFSRPEWRDTALVRFQQDAASVFSECGMTAEQSTAYQLLNVRLWRRSLAAVGAEVYFSVDMGAAIRAGALAAWQLTRPDGVLEGIGTGNPQTVTRAELGIDDTATLPTRLLCPDRGWAANRSSWDDTATHYVLRFGPPRDFHGHDDRGAITWFARGVPVFSDRGVFDRSRGERWWWARSAMAHSTLRAPGVGWRHGMRAWLSTDDSIDRYHVRATSGRTRLERAFTIPLTQDDSEAQLHVVDTGRSEYPQQWYQRWQLAPGWRLTQRTSAAQPAAVHESAGLYLYGSCWWGGYSHLLTRQVEDFPAWRVAAPAQALECGGRDTYVRMKTLWVVSPVEGTFSWDSRTGEYSLQALSADDSATP